MPQFQPNVPVVTTEPRVVVDAGLPQGLHRFQLIVEDSSGNRSEPDEIVVRVKAPPPPIG